VLSVSNSYASISIICVFNKLAVRKECLDQSIEALSSECDGVEYIPVDNVDASYLTAGAALNHGVSLAKNDLMVFVHQDVYLHSLLAVKKAAAQMQSEGFGVIGAIGRGADGRCIGRIRDRFFLLGEKVNRLTEVDSLDEVLFMAPKRQLLSEPIVESSDLAWHAYAVEYGLRMRRKGLRVGVADIPLTHNSLAANVERLDVAYQAVARSYPEFLPVRTTCGDITGRTAAAGRHAWMAAHLWRYRWLRASRTLQRNRAIADGMVGVLVDLRRHIDGIIERAPGRELYIVNCSAGSPFTAYNTKPVELSRGAGTVVFSAAPISEIPAVVANNPPNTWMLITGLLGQDISFLQSKIALTSSILGFHPSAGLWLLIGPSVADLPENWRSKKATPLGPRALVGASILR